VWRMIFVKIQYTLNTDTKPIIVYFQMVLYASVTVDRLDIALYDWHDNVEK